MTLTVSLSACLRNARRRLSAWSAERAYRTLRPAESYPAGSARWLMAAEKQVGGIAREVERRSVSPYDPRTSEEIARGGMTGGDRMFHHGYAPTYAGALRTFVADRERAWTIVEVGILRGTGLAIWSLLFPNARIIGFDIDLSHAEENLAFLRDRGAFARRDPELCQFDQLATTSEDVAAVLEGTTIDLCVDDGLHSDEAILHTAETLYPHLSTKFVYFIEDSYIAQTKLRTAFGDAGMTRDGRLTVIRHRE